MAADEARVYGAMPATARCGVPGCEEWRFEGTADECKVAFADHERERHPNIASTRRREKAERVRAEALERAATRRAEIEAREARRRVARPAPPPPPPEPEPEPEPELVTEPVPAGDDLPARQKWTEESALAALQAYIDREGHPPTHANLAGNRSLPSAPTLRKLCGGGLGDVLVKLGWPRPTTGTRYDGRGSGEAAETGAVAAESAAAEPEAPLADGTPPEPEPLVEAQPEAPEPARIVLHEEAGELEEAGVQIDPATAARRAWLMILEGMRGLVDVYYPEA